MGVVTAASLAEISYRKFGLNIQDVIISSGKRVGRRPSLPSCGLSLLFGVLFGISCIFSPLLGLLKRHPSDSQADKSQMH